MQLSKKTLAVGSKKLKLSRLFSQLNAIDDLEMLANVSKMNAEAIIELIENNRVDKICSLVTTLSLHNFRLQKRTMRRTITLRESIDAAFNLNRKLSQISVKGRNGEYID